MRSNASKSLPKKGLLGKTTHKISSSAKPDKKKSSSKKVQNLLKIKSIKKNFTKADNNETKKESNSSSQSKADNASDGTSASTSKSPLRRGNSPIKKPKNDKETGKNIKKTAHNFKSDKKTIKISPKKRNLDSELVKYKINADHLKITSKLTKSKKLKTLQKSKLPTNNKIQKASKDTPSNEKNCSTESDKKIKTPLLETKDFVTQSVNENIDKNKANNEVLHGNTLSSADNTSIPSICSSSATEMTKIEPERPLKFFTSPRTVDIDVKYCKSTKGALNLSERFQTVKCVDSKTEEKEKGNSSNFISQGPEIDVYTFTEKVDSPKSILSDFRNPINKNVGKVRPIARVKATVFDKSKGETEKKKYSPHRPIEEVVKQLKANKKSEEVQEIDILQRETTQSSTIEHVAVKSDPDEEEKPRAIISKSYKMVARKTSIPGKPFSPIKFLEQESVTVDKNIKTSKNIPNPKKQHSKSRKKSQKIQISDEDLETSKFSFNTNFHYSSSEESLNESNDDNDTKESSESDTPKNKKIKTKKYKKTSDSCKKRPAKDSKDESLTGKEKLNKRRLKLLSMWSGPKKHRMASLNAIAKVHCLYENESRTHMELGLMKTIDRQLVSSNLSKSTSTKKKEPKKKESVKSESTSESEYERRDKSSLESSEDDIPPPCRPQRIVPGIRSAGKYWDPKSCTSSSDDSELDSKKKSSPDKKKATTKPVTIKSDPDKIPSKKKTHDVFAKKKRNRNEVVMDLKDMVVQKRMASLNATAILAASYEKRSSKSSKDDTTSDSCSDESFSNFSKNGGTSGVKSETKMEDTKTEDDSTAEDKKQKVEVIVNQDTDVTITGVYSTHHHEGFCTVSGMQYRISSTSHTKTTATANCESEDCSREEDSPRYTPLNALSSMQPPADHSHHPVSELGGLGRRAGGCSSAFSAPPAASHHEPECEGQHIDV